MQIPKKNLHPTQSLKEVSAVDYSGSYERLPAYYKLKKTIEQEIVDGTKKPGQQIPSERQYASIYNLSVGTVRKALEILVQDGLLERTQGKGTFVRSRAVQNESLRYYRYVKDFSSIHPGLTIKRLAITKMTGVAKVCELLGVKKQSKLICLKRLFSLDQTPMVFSISFFPESLFPDMHSFPPEMFEEQTLYMTIEERYHLPTKEVKEYFSAVSANAETAEYLCISQNDPVLSINMLATSFQSMIFEYRQSYCNTASYYILRDKGLF